MLPSLDQFWGKFIMIDKWNNWKRFVLLKVWHDNQHGIHNPVIILIDWSNYTLRCVVLFGINCSSYFAHTLRICTLAEEDLNRYEQQFHKYQQNKQSLYTSSHGTQKDNNK